MSDLDIYLIFIIKLLKFQIGNCVFAYFVILRKYFFKCMTYFIKLDSDIIHLVKSDT